MTGQERRGENKEFGGSGEKKDGGETKSEG